MAAAPSGVGQVPAGGAGPGAEVVHLYGQWQCAPHVARALNGQVPVNARGNVEVPPLAQAMPLGCVHLQYPGLGPVCRALGISWAPALVGFELSAGRSVPKIDGVVVCEEHERAVVASYLERETARQEAAAARQRREARAAWLQLLYAVRKRLQLADAYQTTNVGAQPTPDVLAAGPSGNNGKSQTKRKRSKAVELEGTQNADDAVASAVAEAARRRIRKRLDKEDEPRLDAHDTCNQAAAADQEEF
ncbi:Rad4 beta-hairpin domain 3-domain-containing protein [Haematococcus lacustris]